ncbi:DUF3768 domain-containing protein [Methylobacterium durans]|uniref:DUF3768 domain-containing protein n=1 Tax=Methylobacterium durans TaxID=2202825 RepID=A0A2U8WBD0_9HYPH|nr:DUF3768 domain-containing protein [Methylobacterium durans]AWN39712.1 hypothetical protein DK389_03120 [Methylobacterium durans]AWN42760.1 hypothetical protein DK389_22465 [Methylobacterium durans]
MSNVVFFDTAAKRRVEPARSVTIRTFNDAFRRSFIGGIVVETAAVLALSEPDRMALIRAVRRFERFHAGNDPRGERDFGAVEAAGERWFWKIDAYDRTMRSYSPDPTDPGVTIRVLTVMRADEY